MWFSNLTIRSGPSFPGNTQGHRFLCRWPCLCDFQPRCSTIWQCLSDILCHSSAGNNTGVTCALAIKEHAIEVGITGGGSPAQNNSSFSRKGPTTPEESSSDHVSVRRLSLAPRPLLIDSTVSIWPVPGQSKFLGWIIDTKSGKCLNHLPRCSVAISSQFPATCRKQVGESENNTEETWKRSQMGLLSSLSSRCPGYNHI